MQNPFQRLENALRPRKGVKWPEQSKFVGIYELLTLLIVVPSILIFQIGFVFVVINVWISSQIAQNRFVLSGISVVIVNLVALPVVYFCLLGLEARFSLLSVAALSISVILTIFGFVALYAQKRQVRNE